MRSRRIISFMFRPLMTILKKNRIFLDIFYGAIPNVVLKPFSSFVNSRFLRLPNLNLVNKAKEFWYTNEKSEFNLDNNTISRKEIFIYGGPNPTILCNLCQKSEWLSRVKQKNLFLSHFCSESKKAKILCEKQGNELWTHFHQNFDFSIGVDLNLPAPKFLYISCDPNSYYLSVDCNYLRLVRKRQMAFSGQFDVLDKPFEGINWGKYDFLYISLTGLNRKFKRPPLPVILEGHDYWGNKELYQWVINWLRPEILLVPDPTRWQNYFKIPKETKLVLYPLFESNFFTRPNLGEKRIDLLVVGATISSFYRPRIFLDRQISRISSEYKIEFSHEAGVRSIGWQKEAYREKRGQKIRFLNKWSEYLGQAKYVIFGRVKYPGISGKHYETLGSGAVPIFPEEPDLKFLGLKQFEHYIPLSEVEGNNERLKYFLDHYENYKYIAENAVRWYRENSDKMLFDDFENLIRELTNFKYPKRIV